jgi:TonB family protein
MKKLQIVIILFALCCVSSAQTKRSKTKTSKSSTTKSQVKKKNISKGIISCGVCNNKALNLVKPVYPLAAKAVRVRGAVGVSVLIDEEGNVSEAEAYSGHPLLRASAVSAALQSKFEPMKLSGNPVKMRGTIIFNFTLEAFNWLEIGNAVGSAQFVKMLPSGFEDEKQMYKQYESADYEEKILIYQNLRASVENKLSSDPKSLWLFQVGILLNEMQAKCCQSENLKETISSLKIFLANSPANISPMLISKLENIINLSENPQLNIYDPTKGNKIYQVLREIGEKLPMLGN